MIHHGEIPVPFGGSQPATTDSGGLIGYLLVPVDLRRRTKKPAAAAIVVEKVGGKRKVPMRVKTLASILIFGVAGVGFAGDAIPAKTLRELKLGTIFLRVKAGTTWGSGSGFLIHSDGKSGYIVTNWHVVHLPLSLGPAKKTSPASLASTIEAVFFSGTKEEVAYQAELVAGLPDEDLAILRVKEVRNLPAPLKLSAAAVLAETMPIFCLGFPFGKLLGVDNENPALTISKGSVSSLRNNKDGELVGIQIDGAMNPGNSGGPVVDKDGQIIGVAVAAIKGAQIGMAIPAAEVRKLINGRAVRANVHLAKADGKGAEIVIEVTLADPFNRLRAVAAHHVYADDAKEKPVLGQSKPLVGAASTALAVKNQKAIGSIRVPADKAVSYWFQIAYTGQDGVDQRLELVSLAVDPGRGLLLLQAKLDHLKGKALTVRFTAADESQRRKVVERVKSLVGNPLKSGLAGTIAGQTTVEVFPVNNPQGFVDRLAEIGRVTGVQGANIFLTVADAGTVVAKIPDLKKEPKHAGKPPVIIKDAPLWTLDLVKMKFPDKTAAGKIHGMDFSVEAVKLDAAGVLTLRQGKDFFPDASIQIFLGLKRGDAIEGKTFHIEPDSKPGKGTPSVHVKHKGPNDKLPRGQAFGSRYAMKLEFGTAKDGMIPSNIYICLPDDGQSMVAGRFYLKLE